MGNRKTTKTEYLIIGNSAGGIGAAEAIREFDKKNCITIVSDEPYPAYSRPLISKYLSRERTIGDMLFRRADFYMEHSIDLLLGNKVIGLNLDSHIAQLKGGQQLAWKKLLIATGGVPIVPRMKGANKKGVFAFLTIKDAIAIDEFLDSCGRAVVIGGGLIGLSVTEALIKRGIDVTVVEMKDRVLNTILDETASSIAEETLRQAGVRVVTNQTVAEVTGETQTEGVVLDNGDKIPCDLVVMAIGVLPRTELVMGTEIKVNRGLVVDRFMCTSHSNIYSCGDVAESYDFVYGENRLTPIWPNAYIGGRTAGYNMAGVRTEYRGGTAMNSLNYFGLDITTAGAVISPDGKNWEVVSQRNDGVYKKIILGDNLVMGMVFIGDIEKSGMIFSLMRDRVNVASFKRALLADDFGLAYLPRELWQERLGVVSSESTSVFDTLAGVKRHIADE
ncbi:MAG: NAD(P)/FAD-dependent oxidoreductase [Chloroflexi bacterium]|nr:NAD(P)/FAD-dependent oxidoreductase [Chloroflexota bacterium]